MRLVKMQRALYAALLTLTLRVPRQLATKATAEQYSVSVLTVWLDVWLVEMQPL